MHGALCDDMGLGKTLQTLTVMQNEIYKDQLRNREENRCSLIICPPTLTEHWIYEIKKYLDTEKVIKATIFRAFTPSSHSKATNEIKNILNENNILIISFSALQKNLDLFLDYQFKFCILDEAHIIKNPKTK